MSKVSTFPKGAYGFLELEGTLTARNNKLSQAHRLQALTSHRHRNSEIPSASMTFAFDRPTGPAADVAELEYVAALVQTAPDLRPDGSLVGEPRRVAFFSLVFARRRGWVRSPCYVCKITKFNKLRYLAPCDAFNNSHLEDITLQALRRMHTLEKKDSRLLNVTPH